jgi:hypothetical protein
VLAAANQLPGEKNGKRFGKMLDSVAKNVKNHPANNTHAYTMLC